MFAKLTLIFIPFIASFRIFIILLIFISAIIGNDSFNMVWDITYPLLDLALWEILPCLKLKTFTYLFRA